MQSPKNVLTQLVSLGLTVAQNKSSMECTFSNGWFVCDCSTFVVRLLYDFSITKFTLARQREYLAYFEVFL
jgi:hypothetical protein